MRNITKLSTLVNSDEYIENNLYDSISGLISIYGVEAGEDNLTYIASSRHRTFRAEPLSDFLYLSYEHLNEVIRRSNNRNWYNTLKSRLCRASANPDNLTDVIGEKVYCVEADAVEDTFNLRKLLTFSNSFIEQSKMYLREYASQKIKKAFGKEFYLKEKITTDLYTDELLPVRKFLCNTIPDFEKKYVGNNETIKPIIAEKIDYNTFILILSDIFVPNKAFANSVRLDGDRSPSIYDSRVYVYIFGKKSNKYIRLFEKALESSNLIRQKMKIAVISELTPSSTSISCVSFDSRDIETLVYSHNEINRIKEHVDKFLSNRSFYQSKQLMYKTGILLYGEPGTGKSTICKILANMYERNIVQINIPTIEKINFSYLTSLINNDDSEYIVLIEDIDTLYLDRQNSKDAKNYEDIINGLLQFLDSNTAPDNVIFVVTTNYVDRLDPALLRSGRIDLKVEVKGVVEQDIDRMLDLFNLSRNLRNEVIEEYKKVKNLEDQEVTEYIQADLQMILLSKLNSVDED